MDIIGDYALSKAHSTFIVLIKSLLLINSLSLYRLQVNYNGLIQCDFEPTTYKNN